MKAKKVSTIYNKHFNTVTYEYRGHYYDVDYPADFNVCCTDAVVQHRNAQRQIDETIDKVKTKSDVNIDDVWEFI